MKSTRRGFLATVAALAAVGAVPATVAKADVHGTDPLVDAIEQSVAGAQAMTNATGERWVTVPENVLETRTALGRLRGYQEGIHEGRRQAVDVAHTPFIEVDGMRISAGDGIDLRVDPASAPGSLTEIPIRWDEGSPDPIIFDAMRRGLHDA